MERSEQKQERIALFPGSFDPFTIGHQSLVKRGLALADRIIIAIGINENKQSCFPLEERLEAIRIRKMLSAMGTEDIYLTASSNCLQC